MCSNMEKFEGAKIPDLRPRVAYQIHMGLEEGEIDKSPLFNQYKIRPEIAHVY